MGNYYFLLSTLTIVTSFVALLFIMTRNPSREQRLLQMITTAVFIYDLGQNIAASSYGNEACIIGEKLSHYGGTHIALCFLAFYCMMVRVSIPKWVYCTIFSVNLLMSTCFTTTVNVFVDDIYFEMDGLGTIRHIRYSPLHHIYLSWQIIIFSIVIGVTIYCFFKKKYVFKYSRPAIIGYFISGAITMLSFYFTTITEAKFDYASTGITFSLIMLFIVTYIFNAFPMTQDTRDDVLDNMEDLVLSVDTTERLIYANRKTREVFASIPEFVYDMPLRGIDDNLDRALDLRDGEEIEIASKYYRLYTKDLFDKRHKLIGHSGIMIDITKEKEFVNEQIKLKEEADSANLAKAQFLAHMSHEIRTPINAILGMDELILREDKDPSTIEYAGNIMRAGKSLLSIINDILDFSKIEAGKMEIVESDYELSPLLKDVLIMARMRAEKKGIDVVISVDKGTPNELCGDEVRIKQIITNILTNAVKYTERGSVYITVGYDKNSDSTADIIIKIQDTGIGIREEDLPKLYGSFERIENSVNHKVEGTGLGMNITLSLLKLMNGKLDVSSVYGQGSTFKITIPQKLSGNEPVGLFAEEIASHTEASLSKYAYTAPDAKILVVDDNKVNRVVAKSLLKRTKISFDEAASGEECLIKVKDNHYDLILMDHLMPGMSGIETFEEMKKQSHMCEGVPVIALTADATVGKKKLFLDAGFNDYISKPIDPVEYEDKVAKYLPKEKVIYL